MSRLTVRGVRIRAVDVPYDRPVETAAGVMRTASLVLLDLRTNEGIVGRAYVRCYTPLILRAVADVTKRLSELLEGASVVPTDVWQMLRSRFLLLGTEGVVGLALNVLDMALWDALARSRDLSLARLLGAKTDRVATYATVRSMNPACAVEEARDLISAGFRAIKVKGGTHSPSEDRAVLRELRDSGGDELSLMCDFNQTLDFAHALTRLQSLEDLRLRWVEEPLLADDLDGLHRLVAANSIPIQAGESWWSPAEAQRSISANASHLVMLDVARVGGVTGWIRAAAAARAAGLLVSSHTYPEFSVQLLASLSNADLLEWPGSAGPIIANPPRIDGSVTEVPAGPGAGIDWDEQAVARYLVQ